MFTTSLCPSQAYRNIGSISKLSLRGVRPNCGWGRINGLRVQEQVAQGGHNHTAGRSFSAISFFIRIFQGPAKIRKAKSFTEDTKNRRSPQRQAPAFHLGPAARTDLIDRRNCLSTAKPLVLSFDNNSLSLRWLCGLCVSSPLLHLASSPCVKSSLSTMSDTTLPEPSALAALPDAPPSSAGRSSGMAAVDQQPPQPAISDELKARLDKVIYSEVSANDYQRQATSVAQQTRVCLLC